MTTDRGPLVLSESEHEEMERLMAAAGIASKRELVARALALFGQEATRVPPPVPSPPGPLAEFLPPPPRRRWWWPWSKPLTGRTADEVLHDLRGERSES